MIAASDTTRVNASIGDGDRSVLPISLTLCLSCRNCWLANEALLSDVWCRDTRGREGGRPLPPLLPDQLWYFCFSPTFVHAPGPCTPSNTLTGILEETTNKGNRTLEKALFSHADAVTQKFFGEAVYYRGICEFSNVCANDCGYCGIRKHQKGVRRYTMPIHEVLEVRGREVVYCTWLSVG